MSDIDPIFDWWKRCIADRESGAARALSAKLRRAGEVEALAHPQVHELALRTGLRDARRLALLVRVLAEVRENKGEPLFARLGPSRLEEDDGALSKLRFQKLLRSEGDELYSALRRAITMADRACNVTRLGRDLRWLGDKTRQRWCFDYFGGQAPAELSAVPQSDLQEHS
tara:strand:- start:1358 stop:1867 length:510 start_codon:yes stop_codon:yes gene_type:complete